MARRVGSHGNDTLLGSRGQDTLLGQGGNDQLHGGPDIDYIHGGNGSDRLLAVSPDTALGGAGVDFRYNPARWDPAPPADFDSCSAPQDSGQVQLLCVSDDRHVYFSVWAVW